MLTATAPRTTFFKWLEFEPGANVELAEAADAVDACGTNVSRASLL